MAKIPFKKIEEKILFWLEKGKIKSVDIDYENHTVIFYDERGKILMIRTNVPFTQMQQIEYTIKQRKFKTGKVSFYTGEF